MAKKRTLKVLIAVFLLTLPAVLSAAPVSRSQAQAIAAKFMQQKGMATAKPDMSYRAPRIRQASNSYYYVFNATTGGFVIVSGDDRTPQILGYSDTGTLDMDKLPDNIKSFLQTYADEIKHLDDANITEAQAKPVLKAKESTTHAINPLLSSTWGQNSPYNNYCPTLSDGTTAVTGCVATAMAQIMYYFKYPDKIIAAIPDYTTSTYKLSVSGVGIGATLEWDKMHDSYTGSESDAYAVANLMSYAGKSVEMDYGRSSSANSYDVAPAMKKYFDYSCYQINRSDYTLTQFEQTIYNEIANSRPVLFSGRSTGGGHEFVLDGYDVDGLFHVNWGWNGYCNGYFLVSVLNPHDNSGTGASSTTDGYAMRQSAVIGFARGASTSQDVTLGMTVSNLEFDYTKNTVTARLTNGTGTTNKFDISLAVIKDDGSVGVTFGNKYTTGDVPNGNYYDNKQYNLSYTNTGLKDSTYTVAIVTCIDGTSKWTYSPYSTFTLNVYNNGEVSAYKSSNSLSLSSWNFTGSKIAGEEQTMDITIKNYNSSEYYNNVYLFASTDENNKGSKIQETALTVSGNDSTTIQLSFTPDSAATYYLWLYGDENGVKDYVAQTSVEIAEGSTASGSDLSVSFSPATENTFYGKNIKGSYTLTNNGSTAYTGDISLTLYKYDGSSSYIHTEQTNSSISISAGSSIDRTFSYGQDSGEYLLALYYWDSSNNYHEIGRATYTLADGMTVYKNGTATGQKLSKNVVVSTGTTAIDFSGVEDSIKSVSAPSFDDSNVLYYFSTSCSVATTMKARGKNVIINGSTDKLTLKDGLDFNAPMAFTASKATYTRTPSKGTHGTGGWQTICLPFEVNSITADGFDNSLQWFTSADDTGKDFWLMEFSLLDGSTVVFGYNNSSTLAANTPYIIAVPDDHWGSQYSLVNKEITFSGTNVSIGVTNDTKMITGSSVFNFTGTTQKGTVKNAYLLNNDGDAFNYSDTNTANAFTAYFVNKTSATADNQMTSLNIAIEGSGAVTGIGKVKSETSKGDDANAPVYNLAGQRVGKDYKGIVIQNGRKHINK